MKNKQKRKQAKKRVCGRAALRAAYRICGAIGHRLARAKTKITQLRAPKSIEPSTPKRVEKIRWKGEDGSSRFQNPSHGRRCRMWPPRMARRWRDGGGLPLPLPLHAAPHPPPAAAPPRAAPSGQCCRDRWSVQLRQVPAAPHGKRNSSSYTIFPQFLFCIWRQVSGVLCWTLVGVHT
jgi:hypothetical protein